MFYLFSTLRSLCLFFLCLWFLLILATSYMWNHLYRSNQRLTLKKRIFLNICIFLSNVVAMRSFKRTFKKRDIFFDNWFFFRSFNKLSYFIFWNYFDYVFFEFYLFNFFDCFLFFVIVFDIFLSILFQMIFCSFSS